MKNKINKRFENLIIGYISQESTVDDLKKILERLKEPKNIKAFKAYIKINFYSIYLMNQSDSESIIQEIKARINREESKIKRSQILVNILKYAAIFILIFGIGFYSSNNFLPSDEIQKIIPRTNEIVLSSEDDKVILNKRDKNSEDKNIISNINLIQKSNQLIYDNDIDIKEIVYHS